MWGPQGAHGAALWELPHSLSAHRCAPATPPQAPTDLHMLDFRELELLGDEGGVW